MSSGFSYPQPIFASPIYNPAFYLTLDASGYLTYEYAQTLYLDKNDYRLTYITGITQGTATQGVALIPGINNDINGIGALSCSSLTVNGSSVSSPPSYVADITPGTAANSKALVLGASGEISTITSLTATSIAGTLQTAAQTNITSLGTLSSLTIGGNLTFTGASRTITGLSSLSATSLTGTLQTAAQTNITSLGTLTGLTIGGNLVFSGVSRSITGLDSISATSITGTLQNAGQTNITSLGTLTGLSIGGNLTFTGASRTITGLSSLSATSLTGTLQTAAQTNITSLGTLTGVTCSGITQITNTTASTLYTNGALVLSGGLGIAGDANMSGNLYAAGALTSAAVDTQKNYINSVLTIDSSRNITAASISGTISTAAQPNITSIGTQTLLKAVAGRFEVAANTLGSGSAGNSTYPIQIRNDSDTAGAISGISLMVDSTIADVMPPSCVIAATRVAGSYATCDLKFFTRIGPAAYDQITERMKISQAGRITVGSGNAESKFQVIGDTSILYGSWVRVAEYWSGHATQMKCGLIMYNEAGGTNDHGVGFGTYTNDPISWFVNGSTGMVFNTSKRLSVNKTAGPEATIHAGGMIWADEQFHSKQNVDGKAIYRTNWSQANYLAMGTDATVGAMRLGVCDSVFNWVSYAPVRGGAYTNASDRRIKNDIIDIPYGLDQVMAMKPKKFSLRSDNSTHVGFIAQEIVEVIPECVSGSESADDELNENGEPINPMGIDLASLVSVLCKAIQELKAEVNELRAIIAE